MKAWIGLAVIFLVASCSTSPKTVIKPAPSAPPYIAQSNQLIEEYVLDGAKTGPESASSLGYRQFDSQATQVVDDTRERDVAFLNKWKARLEKEIAGSKDPEYIIDMKVLLKNIENSFIGIIMTDKYGDIPYVLGSRAVYSSLSGLINPQSDAARKSAGVERFKLYVNGQNGGQPFLEAWQSRILYVEKKYAHHAKRYSFRTEMQTYLKESPDYLKGIKELLGRSGRTDWTADYEKFAVQVRKYDNFLRRTQLPKTVTDYKIPYGQYAHLLRTRGITASPEELIETGLKDYKELYKKFQITAQEVAKKLKLKDSRPAAVIAYLKSKQITKLEDVQKLYADANLFIEDTIRKNQIVSLPASPLKIRMAGDAESKANPVPSLIPPPLVNNKGERPEFLVPTASDGKLPFDDFSYKEASYVLTAHEGRPGHDLQFSSMLDNGVSIIRARYAFNNVNVEGWGLYAEDLIYPYLPLEAQFVAQQTRLWRVARMFLDPQIQLGQIQPQRVVDLFTKELGVSKVMAGLEVKRYTFDDPGQAPAYYFGLKKILAAKEALKLKLGTAFDEKCFNDKILSMGLLPMDMILERVSNLECKTK